MSKPNTSINSTIFMMYYISSLGITNIDISDPKTFLWVAESVAGAAVVNPNGTRKILDNAVSTF